MSAKAQAFYAGHGNSRGEQWIRSNINGGYGMKVAAIQLNAVFADVERNLRQSKTYIREAARDIIRKSFEIKECLSWKVK